MNKKLLPYKRLSYKERAELSKKIKTIMKGVERFEQSRIYWSLLAASVAGDQRLAAYWLRDEVFNFLNDQTERKKEKPLKVNGILS